MVLKSKKGSEEFHTAINLLIGSIFFIAVAVITMFMFVSNDIEAVFSAGSIDVDKISTRIIFSPSCLAQEETVNHPHVTDPDRSPTTQVHAGVIDLTKFTTARINKCVGYSMTEDYDYNIEYEYIETGATGTINPKNGDVTTCTANGKVFIHKDKIYPVLIDDGSGDYHNGRINISVSFCYLNESI